MLVVNWLVYTILPSDMVRSYLILRQRWRAGAGFARKPCLHEDLLHTVFLLVKLVVDLGQIFDAYAVRDHFQRVDFPFLDLLQKVFPVQVHGGLAVSNEADASLHDGANVEVVGVSDVYTRDADATVVLDRLDHFIQDFGGIRLHARREFYGVKPALWIFSGNAFKGDVWAVSINHLLELVDHTLAAAQL